MTNGKKRRDPWVDSEQGDMHTGIPPAHSGTVVDAQPMPDRKVGEFPIVGIGASAGGLVNEAGKIYPTATTERVVASNESDPFDTPPTGEST